MKALVREKEQAMMMRRRGFSYRDILASLPVAKSTLSEWLKDMPLTRIEKDLLKRQRNANVSRGRLRAAAALTQRRLDREKVILGEAQIEYVRFRKDPLFHVGVSLYWAEGSKRSGQFAFTNSDAEMMGVMVNWIERFLKYPRQAMKARLYTHKPFMHEKSEEYWSRKTRIPLKNFQRTIFKPTSLLVKKRPNYRGCLRVHIDRVSFLKKMLFWQKMLIEEFGKR